MVKNIIVVGASFSGHDLVNNLASTIPDDCRLLLVERSEFTLHVPGVVRACVVPGWEDTNITARVTQDAVFPSGSRHRVIAPNTVVELKKTSIVLENEFEGSTEVPFEKCILALGAQQAEPMRPHVGSSREEYKNMLRKMQADIKAATKILIVGGGTVGVEVTGEISTQYPDKKVIIVHADAGLLHPTPTPPSTPDARQTYVPEPTDPKLGDSLSKQLRSRNIEILLNDRVATNCPTGPLGSVQSIPLESGHFVEADYVFVSVGNRPNSGLVEAVDPGSLTSNGYIIVDEHFHVVPGSPTSPMAGNYYALGDVASVKAWKTCVSALAESGALANIILAELKGQKAKAYVPGGNIVVVTLGAKGGAGFMQVPIFGNVSFPGFVVGLKNKDLFVDRVFTSRFRGPRKIAA